MPRLPKEPPELSELLQDPRPFVARYLELGAVAVLLDLVAHSIFEIYRTPGPGRLQVEVLGPLRARIRDGGRGVNFHPEPGEAISHAEAAFTRIYPIPAPSPDLDSGLIRHIWRDRSSWGPVVAVAFCQRFQLESERGKSRHRMVFARGKKIEATTSRALRLPGTEQELDLLPELFEGVPKLTAESLGRELEGIAAEFPRLRFQVWDRART